MILLCRDESCLGHDERAGDDPADDCWFCGEPLEDLDGYVLTAATFATMVCQRLGHCWEGRLDVDGSAFGACARCGATASVQP